MGMGDAFTIGRLARDTGTKVPTIRFYEEIGLLGTPIRTASGHRRYGSGDVRRLAFIRSARKLGFSTEEIRSLLGLTEHPEQSCGAASDIARRHLGEVERHIEQLIKLRDELRAISTVCPGSNVSDCGVIAAIAHSPA
jgi:DNA-binding transcriptional MerR regulator